MYISSFLPLQTALSGVEAAQEELATTGNNIADANNPDYEEQSVTLAPNASLRIAAGYDSNGMQLGTGVSATGVVNSSDQYLDNAARNQHAVSSQAGTQESYASQLQDLLGENNHNAGAISSDLSSFWGDWNNLADNPGNSGAQQAVVEDGETVANSISQLSAGITQLQGQAADQYENLTQDAPGGQVYDDVTQLASLNGQLKQAAQGGYTDNDALDERNAVLDDLSSLASIKVTNEADGTVNLDFGGNPNLVAGTTVNWPSSPGTTMSTSTFTFPGSASTVHGSLGALLSFGGSGGTADQINSQLDSVAQQLASSVNSLTASSTSGVTQFFDITTGGSAGSAAASLAVNPALVSDPHEVPTTATGQSGANDIAVAVSELAGGAPDQSYEGFVESVGGIAQQASSNATAQAALSTQISNQRQSAEGVDQNQEMTNLVEEQQAYEASAKVMGTFSTMMDALMEVVGR